MWLSPLASNCWLPWINLVCLPSRLFEWTTTEWYLRYWSRFCDAAKLRVAELRVWSKLWFRRIWLDTAPFSEWTSRDVPLWIWSSISLDAFCVVAPITRPPQSLPYFRSNSSRNLFWKNELYEGEKFIFFCHCTAIFFLNVKYIKSQQLLKPIPSDAGIFFAKFLWVTLNSWEGLEKFCFNYLNSLTSISFLYKTFESENVEKLAAKKFLFALNFWKWRRRQHTWQRDKTKDMSP